MPTPGVTDDPPARSRVVGSRVTVITRATRQRALSLGVLILIALDSNKLPIADKAEDRGAELEERHIAVGERRRGVRGNRACAAARGATTAEERRAAGGRGGAGADAELLLVHDDADGGDALVEGDEPRPARLVCACGG